MPTLFRDRDTRQADDPRGWLWLAALALVSTAVLSLAQAELQSPKPSTSGPRDAHVTRTAAPPIDRTAKNAAEPATAVNRRPVPYSSVDTQTLARARAHANGLAGKRDPVADNIAPVGGREITAAPAPVVPASPAVPAADVSSAGLSRDRSRPVVAPTARIAQPERADIPARSATTASARQPSVDSASAYERQAPAHRMTPRSSAAQTHLGLRELPQRGSTFAVPSISASDLPRAPSGATAAEYRARAHRHAPPLPDVGVRPVDRAQDATTAHLDAQWERRERWFRERLQRR